MKASRPSPAGAFRKAGGCGSSPADPDEHEDAEDRAGETASGSRPAARRGQARHGNAEQRQRSGFRNSTYGAERPGNRSRLQEAKLVEATGRGNGAQREGAALQTNRKDSIRQP